MLELTLPAQVLWILDTLDKGGFEGYVVGGCVRDSLMGTPPHDWDITTNASPQQVTALFPHVKVIETGLRHGTVTLLLEGQHYEVTTYRMDGSYTDHRRPDQVSFTSTLREDLERRDFTINGMAYHPDSGLADFFGGQQDVEQRRIRCIGNSRQRFEEDGLRIMRALRFSSLLDFSIEGETAQSIHDCRQLLSYISAERLREELCRLLLGRGVARILMEYADVLTVFLPEIIPAVGFDQRHPYHDLDVWQHTVKAVACAPPDLTVRLSLLLHDLAKPSCHTLDGEGIGHFYRHDEEGAVLAERVLHRLRFDNQRIAAVTQLVRYHDVRMEPTIRQAKRWLSRLGEELFFQLLEVQRADYKVQRADYLPQRLERLEELSSLARSVLAEGDCLSLRGLAVTGEDLMSAGIPKGPAVGRILKGLLEGVLEDRWENTREALLREVPVLQDLPAADSPEPEHRKN